MCGTFMSKTNRKSLTELAKMRNLEFVLFEPQNSDDESEDLEEEPSEPDEGPDSVSELEEVEEGQENNPKIAAD